MNICSYFRLKCQFDNLIGDYVNNKISRDEVEEWLHWMLHKNPASARNFLQNRTKNAIPIMYDALCVALRFSDVINDDALLPLFKCLSQNWQYLFSEDELPEDVSESKQWHEMFDACYFFANLAMQKGWYCLSDNSKLFLVARSLESKKAELKEVEQKVSPESGNKADRENGKKSPGKPTVRVVVRIKDCKGKNCGANKTPAESRATPPEECDKVCANTRPATTVPEALKVYKVAVQRTYYGEVCVPATNEDEAVEIATGNRPMHDGTWASEQFKPASSDTYLEICDMGDETVVEVKN